jgi:hypothetical protein
LGPPPWQGIACVDVNADGSVAAFGTISPPGDPNLIVLDANGRIVSQRRVGLRWIDEVTVSGDGRLVAALTGTPEGTAADAPRLYAFRQDQALTDVAGVKLANLSFRGRLGEARSNHFGGRLFHFGDHSNHLSPALAKSAGNWLVAADDGVLWLESGRAESSLRADYGPQGFLTALAAGNSGLAIIGLGGVDADTGKNLLVLKPDKAAPVAWSRTANGDVAPSPAPEPPAYGPSGPVYEDAAFQAPLAVAVDATGERFAVADYEGRRRVCHPKDGGTDFPFGIRFTPSSPTIHVYDAKGAELRRVGPESFPELTWCDLTFTSDGRHLLLSPHNWVSHGLGGQPFLPIDERACTLYLLEIANGAVETLRLPDAISSVAVDSNGRIAVGCWNHRVYLFDGRLRPLPNLPHGVSVGAASLIRFAQNGQRLVVATAAGVALAFDSDGRPLWRTDLNQAVTPGDKPWTKQQQAGAPLMPGVWRTNGGLAHSDMGSQLVVQAPQGLLLIDPNAGASFEQNWAKIESAGLDPRQVKYVLLTHEHGDHAPGAYLWRLITGAQVVAGAEAAYLLRHHIPGGTGYGFHPPQPVDIAITQDTELELAGLKVRCLRLPGHTYGSMGYAFETDGRLCVATGDLIMPGLSSWISSR